MPIAKILQTLVAHDVEFIVVGGMAAVLQGAPVRTLDVDVVYSLEPANVSRMPGALGELEARFRDDPRGLRPERGHVASRGHKLLVTGQGALDLPGTIEDDTTYEDLLPHSVGFEVAGVHVRVLSLERLVQAKRHLDRPKDRAMLNVLEATIEEAKKRG